MAKILGILNLSPDSFSDGGRFSSLESARAHARDLHRDGADFIDLGAVSSNPSSEGLPPDLEIERLEPLVQALHDEGFAVSLDTFAPEVQQWGLKNGVAMLNDIRGFSDPSIWPELADGDAKLVVMHGIQRGPADRRHTDPVTIMQRVLDFFDERVVGMVAAGISRSRLLVDPGMGFFLGDTPEPSIEVLRNLEKLRDHTGCEVLVSTSRKSFLGAILGGRPPADRQQATLASELYALTHGADWVRTHEPRPLRDALRIWRAITEGGC